MKFESTEFKSLFIDCVRLKQSHPEMCASNTTEASKSYLLEEVHPRVQIKNRLPDIRNLNLGQFLWILYVAVLELQQVRRATVLRPEQKGESLEGNIATSVTRHVTSF